MFGSNRQQYLQNTIESLFKHNHNYTLISLEHYTSQILVKYYSKDDDIQSFVLYELMFNCRLMKATNE